MDETLEGHDVAAVDAPFDSVDVTLGSPAGKEEEEVAVLEDDGLTMMVSAELVTCARITAPYQRLQNPRDAKEATGREEWKETIKTCINIDHRTYFISESFLIKTIQQAKTIHTKISPENSFPQASTSIKTYGTVLITPTLT